MPTAIKSESGSTSKTDSSGTTSGSGTSYAIDWTLFDDWMKSNELMLSREPVPDAPWKAPISKANSIASTNLSQYSSGYREQTGRDSTGFNGGKSISEMAHQAGYTDVAGKPSGLSAFVNAISGLASGNILGTAKTGLGYLSDYNKWDKLNATSREAFYDAYNDKTFDSRLEQSYGGPTAVAGYKDSQSGTGGFASATPSGPGGQNDPGEYDFYRGDDMGLGLPFGGDQAEQPANGGNASEIMGGINERGLGREGGRGEKGERESFGHEGSQEEGRASGV